MGTDREQAVAANRARLLARAAPPPVRPEVFAALFRPAACPGCHYPLTGLDAGGLCPECGLGYGPPEVWLYGTATGSMALHGRIALTRRSLWAALLAVPFVVAGVMQTGPMAGTNGLWRPLPWAAAGLSLVIGLWSRGAASRAVQVLLTPSGVLQAAHGRGRTAHARLTGAGLTPWRSVRGARLATLSDGRLHVWIGAGDSPWVPRREYVNALVQCPPEAVSALRQRIEQWRAATPQAAGFDHRPVDATSCSPWNPA